MAIPHFRYSFAKGFGKLTLADAKKARTELYEYLGCTNRSVFSRRKHSFRDIPIHIYDGINRIFKKYGIEADDVWTISKTK